MKGFNASPILHFAWSSCVSTYSAWGAFLVVCVYFPIQKYCSLLKHFPTVGHVNCCFVVAYCKKKLVSPSVLLKIRWLGFLNVARKIVKVSSKGGKPNTLLPWPLFASHIDQVLSFHLFVSWYSSCEIFGLWVCWCVCWGMCEWVSCTEDSILKFLSHFFPLVPPNHFLISKWSNCVLGTTKLENCLFVLS